MAKEDLKPIQTTEEAKKRGAAGGRKSGEARRRKKELRECLEALLEMDVKAKNGQKMSGAEAISAKLFEKALRGDLRAFEILRDTAGQKPVERIQVAEVDQETVDEIKAAMIERQKEREKQKDDGK